MSELESIIATAALEISRMALDEVGRRMQGESWEHHQLLYKEVIKALLTFSTMNDYIGSENGEPAVTENIYLEVREHINTVLKLNQN